MPTIPTILLILLSDAPDWDFVFKTTIGAFGLLMSIIAYLFKRKIEAYDKHLDECRAHAIASGRMEERMERVEKNTNWVGNCVVAIGTKLGVQLPNQPD